MKSPIINKITDFIGFTNSRAVLPVEPERENKFSREALWVKEILFSWAGTHKTSQRDWDPRVKKTVLIIGFTLIFLFAIMQEFFLILVIASIGFFSYVVSNNQLDEFKYELSTHGISISGQMYYWDELTKFFFSSNFGSDVLGVDVKDGPPSRLFIVYHKKDKEKIIEIMSKYLPYLPVEPMNFMDKAYLSVVDKFDLSKKK